MSYNIDTFILKELRDVSFPVSALYTYHRSQFHPERTNNYDGTVRFGDEEGAALTGTIKDDVFYMTDIECTGEGSGSFMDYILEPALKQSKGVLRASCVWEGGDSINKLLVEDGEVDWIDIEI